MKRELATIGNILSFIENRLPNKKVDTIELEVYSTNDYIIWRINMTKEEIEKKIYFAEMIIGVINHVERPILMYEEEKQVVKEALSEYKYKLESELRGR